MSDTPITDEILRKYRCHSPESYMLLRQGIENLEYNNAKLLEENKALKNAILACKQAGNFICSHSIGIKKILDGGDHQTQKGVTSE